MKILYSLVTGAVIGLGVAASAGEPTKLSNVALDGVTAGFDFSGGIGSGAFTKGVFANFGNSATVDEKSTSTTTGLNGVFKTSSAASAKVTVVGPGPVSAGGYSSAFGLFGNSSNGN